VAHTHTAPITDALLDLEQKLAVTLHVLLAAIIFGQALLDTIFLQTSGSLTFRLSSKIFEISCFKKILEIVLFDYLCPELSQAGFRKSQITGVLRVISVI